MTKEQRTIKVQAQQIAELENLVKSKDEECKRTEDYRGRLSDELDNLHETFDLLGVPRRVKNTYHDLSANSRLTLFLAELNNIKVEQPKEGE